MSDYLDQVKLAGESYDLRSRPLESALTPYIASGMTAPSALSVGDYVMAAGTLYRVTADIANGAALTVGTNVTATTVADELETLGSAKLNKTDWIVNDPGTFLLSKILCPDFDFTNSGRKYTKSFNHLKMEYMESASTARTLMISGDTQRNINYGASGVSSINQGNLVDVGLLSTKGGSLYTDVYSVSSYTGIVTMRLYVFWCSVQDDTVTLLDNAYFTEDLAKTRFSTMAFPTAPAGATHFAVGVAGSSSAAVFDTVFNFRIVPATT